MKCEECLHWPVCRSNMFDEEDEYYQNTHCHHKTSRSELNYDRYKIGTPIYYVDDRGELHQAPITNIIFVTEAMAFDKAAIGKTVFLSEKDAKGYRK